MFEKYALNDYRDDIQGLRAVGAIIIMVFHIWFNKVSGGVDVFFVISGFLMTSVLLKGYFISGTISPLPFWGGVIKRVAPSAYVVLGVTLIISYLILSPLLIHGILNEIIASALHIENLQLIRLSTDYLAIGGRASPVQQFWALSIQIQFYLVFPLIIIPLAYLSKKKSSSTPLVLGIIFTILCSFIYALFLTRHNAAMSYFSPLSRIWEFLLGSLTFLWVSNTNVIRGRGLLGMSGLALIIGGAIFIPRGAAFSGPVSLIPVLGAILIIVSGNGGSGVINKILANKYLVFLGGISFTIYLWHWPILIFYREYFGYESVGLVQGIGIILIAIVLAYFTNLKIESPFKRIPKEKVVMNFSIGVLFFVPVVVTAFVFRYEVLSTTKNTIVALKNESIESYTGEIVYLEQQAFVPERKRLLTIKHRVPATYYNDCNQSVTGVEVTTCNFGDLSSNKEVVLVGGSHAAQWITALDEIGKKNKFKVINMTKAYCPLGVIGDSNSSCHQWNKQALKEIITINPYAVITNSTRTSIDQEEFIPKSYIDSWKTLANSGITIVGIRDNPRFDFDVPSCLYKNRKSLNVDTCSTSRASIFLPTDPTIAHKDIIKSIDMSDMFCTADQCIASFSGKIMYRDSEHISVEYAYFLQDNLESKLKAVMPSFD